MAQRAPRPWEVNATRVSCTVVCGSQIIATVNHFNVDCMENARLIAAAPDQNDALHSAPSPVGEFANVEEANNWLNRYHDWYFGQRVAVIAKAQGGV